MNRPITWLKTALATLELELPARVAAYNALGGLQLEAPPVLDSDDASLSAVDSGRAYYLGGRETHFQFPAIEASVTDVTMHDFSVPGTRFDIDTPNLWVVAWVQDKEGTLPVLYEKLLAFTQCIFEVLLQPEAFGHSVRVVGANATYGAPDPDARRFEYVTLFGILGFELNDMDGTP